MENSKALTQEVIDTKLKTLLTMDLSEFSVIEQKPDLLSSKIMDVSYSLNWFRSDSLE
jgi:hypothetical protein